MEASVLKWVRRVFVTKKTEFKLVSITAEYSSHVILEKLRSLKMPALLIKKSIGPFKDRTARSQSFLEETSTSSTVSFEESLCALSFSIFAEDFSQTRTSAPEERKSSVTPEAYPLSAAGYQNLLS